MGSITHLGDAVKWARDYSGPLFHALLCDAPYEMAFMGRDWDRSGVAFDPATWEAFARVLHPGAFLFVCAGTINDDLISVAMREAGLRKFHKVLGWAYGSGFPKASRIDTQIDKAAGAEREVVGYKRGKGGENLNTISRPKGRDNGSARGMGAYGQGAKQIDIDIPIEEPSTSLARAFAGHRYGLQALKPAIETILIFQKPYEGKPIDDITRTGAGCLWIDGGRIGTPDGHGGGRFMSSSGKTVNKFGEYQGDGFIESASGRWPSNFLLLDEGAARALDEMSGESPSRWGKPSGGNSIYGSPVETSSESCKNDSGGASRFFFQVSEQIDEADPVFYSAKASRKERDAGLEGFDLRDVAYMDFREAVKETENFVSKYPDGSPRPMNKTRNPHPTVKPLSLTQYLATLLLPPPEYAPRRLFVPFAGVGSEQIGAVMAGWEEVEGVEITEEYIPINRARLAYWQGKKLSKSNGKSKGPKPSNGHKPDQLELI